LAQREQVSETLALDCQLTWQFVPEDVITVINELPSCMKEGQFIGRWTTACSLDLIIVIVVIIIASTLSAGWIHNLLKHEAYLNYIFQCSLHLTENNAASLQLSTFNAVEVSISCFLLNTS
jgi:hypothetical protein